MASGNVRSSAIDCTKGKFRGGSEQKWEVLYILDKPLEGFDFPSRLFSILWVTVKNFIFLCQSKLCFVVCSAWASLQKYNWKTFTQVISYFLPLCTGTGWTSLETSVLPARETRERRERRSWLRHWTSLSSPHSGSGAHYEIRSCSLGPSQSSPYTSHSLITVSHFLSHILRLLVIVLTQCDC